MLDPLSISASPLTGQLLVAMPQMQDPRFFRSVIYICGQDENGAMGLVLNKLIDTIDWKQLLQQLEIPASEVDTAENFPIHYGGPVEMGRGFVLHSGDYMHEASVKVSQHISLTATVEILRAIAQGEGPKRKLLALGYAGWSAGQLEAELQINNWLQIEADEELIFNTPNDEKWDRAIAKLGIRAEMLSEEMGHA